MGYTTSSAVDKDQYIALCTVFENVAGGAIKVKDLVTSPDLVGSKTFNAADQIWRWNTGTASWTKYSYYGGRGVFYWAKEGEETEVLDTEVIGAGVGFFFKRGSAASATVPAIIKFEKK